MDVKEFTKLIHDVLTGVGSIHKHKTGKGIGGHFYDPNNATVVIGFEGRTYTLKIEDITSTEKEKKSYEEKMEELSEPSRVKSTS